MGVLLEEIRGVAESAVRKKCVTFCYLANYEVIGREGFSFLELGEES